MNVYLNRRDFYHDSYCYSDTIADGATGDTLIINEFPKGGSIGISLIAGTNTGKFQASMSWDADTESLPSNAVWFDVELADTTGTVVDAILDPITVLRGVSTSGEIKIEVVI